MNDILITEIDKSNLPAILALQKQCYKEEAEIYNDFNIPPMIQTLESIQNDFLNQLFLKATFGSRIIGSVRAYQNSNTCLIGRLIVDRNFQNKGIGKELMKAIERRFDNAKRFELFTGYKSLKNILLYEKLGYSEFKRERINEKLELVFMEKFSKK